MEKDGSIEVKIATLKNKARINEVVDIHMQSFTGFFLTFLGKGFLRQLYKGFIEHENSGLLVAVEEDTIIGFLAYSEELSSFYKYLLRRHFISLAWYAGIAFIRRPKIFLRLIRAFSYSKDAKRNEKYVELSSIGVLPKEEGKGVGSKLISTLKRKVDASKYQYIKLETDAMDNEAANGFYKKNGFVLEHVYETHEGRKMNEYRYYFSEEAV